MGKFPTLNSDIRVIPIREYRYRSHNERFGARKCDPMGEMSRCYHICTIGRVGDIEWYRFYILYIDPKIGAPRFGHDLDRSRGLLPVASVGRCRPF